MSKERKVAGVIVSKVLEKVLDETCAELKLGKHDGVDAKIKAVASHFKETMKADSLADCTTCGGDSDVNYRRCPYCGDGDVLIPKAPLPAAEPPRTELVTRKPVLSVNDLDKSVDRIQKLKVTAAKSIWELGQEIRLNYEQELWKLRRDAKGVVKYRNWKQFTAAELGISHTHAYRLMDVAAAFSKQEIEQIGATKLGVMLQLPEPHRSKLIALAKDEATSRGELDSALRNAKGGASPALPPRPPQVDDVTVTLRVQPRLTLALLVRPGEAKKGESKPARKLTEDPWCVEEMENGVRRIYHVKANSKGELVLIISTNRVAS